MLRARLQAEWQLKLFLTVLLNLLFWGGYGWLSRHAVFPLRALPVTWLDQAVRFQPQPWSWIYLSQFTFTSTLPWLLTTRASVCRYAAGAGALTLVSFAFFLLLPTAGPRPVQIGADRAMQFIARHDGVLNAFPSLHAAYLVYCSALAARIFSRATPSWMHITWVLWGSAILYATLATKQHYALDLLAGGALGAGADWLAWRGSSAAARMPVSKGRTSQVGVR